MLSSMDLLYKLNPVPAKIKKLNATVYINAVLLFLLLCPPMFLTITDSRCLALGKKIKNIFTKTRSTSG
jgi:hypothetical protein